MHCLSKLIAMKETGYSIRDLEVLSGIKMHTIRIWEKRYKPTNTQPYRYKYSLVRRRRSETPAKHFDAYQKWLQNFENSGVERKPYSRKSTEHYRRQKLIFELY